uniref:cDNA clone:J023110C02, full insert sequence n=1 Tax=Oryza sativa subsp. japonica TaxID=39947 RepID=B7F717_ORYSJ|nr:unnamed protein product [Oryza sativa Japonica Group]
MRKRGKEEGGRRPSGPRRTSPRRHSQRPRTGRHGKSRIWMGDHAGIKFKNILFIQFFLMNI